MAFEIGTASSTFDLYNKLRTFMSTISGWQIHSNIDGYDGYDTVYYSNGTHGSYDIFVRIRAGLTENFILGLDQYDYGGGDTGYINFFSYGHFPEDGDAYAGSTELGKYGPRIYYFCDEGDTNNAYYQHVLSQQQGGTAAGSENAGSGIGRSGQSRIRRRWRQVNDFLTGDFGLNPDEQCAFDGKRYFYFGRNASTEIYRYTVERSHAGSSGTAGTGDLVRDDSSTRSGMVVVEHRDTREQYLYGAHASTTSNGGFFRIRLDDESFSFDTSLAEPSWPLRTYSTFFGSNDDDTSNNGDMVWDGGDHIYFIRGGFGSSNNLVTPDWGVYTISTNTWVNTEIPSNPSFPDLPYDTGNFTAPWLLFVSKNTSGFTYNRLYLFNGGTGLHYMDLDDDSGLPIYSSWQSQSVSRDPDPGSPDRIGINRARRFFIFPPSSTDIEPLDDINAVAQDRSMFVDELTESGTYLFEAVDQAWLPERADSGAYYYFVDGYSSRVRTAIDGDTDYIFIADRDRLIVATKSNNIWSACYAGAFESAFGLEPIATVAENVENGISRTIKLSNIQGSFEPNQTYTIIGTTQETDPVTHFVDGMPRRSIPSENVKVTHVGDDYVVASIKYDYKEGDRIGIDPQPCGVWMADLYKFQTTNIFTTFYDDHDGSNDPSVQIYTTAVEDSVVNSSTQNERTLDYIAWEIPLTTTDSEFGFKGTELRGTLIGVYAISSDSSLQVGDTIFINDAGYYIISLPGTQTKFAIGPLE